jgi:4-carboxymuconolactone decarboxylase
VVPSPAKAEIVNLTDAAREQPQRAGRYQRDCREQRRRSSEDMSTPMNTDVRQETAEALTGLARGDLEFLGEAVELREAARQNTGLDSRTFSLVKIAALVALDSPPASYLWQVANALDAGATPEDILGVVRAVAPQVGGPRAVAAAPEIMVALGLSLPDGQDV